MTDSVTNTPPPPLLRYFEYSHLPVGLQAVSKPFRDLAIALVVDLPAGPETTTALRKLLEAKDCAVRSAMDGPPPARLQPRPVRDDPQA